MLGQIEGYRLSPQQRHLWLLQQEGAPYLSQCVVRVAGELDRELLREALYRVIRRHEVLRTTFHRPPGIRFPVQSIGEDCQAQWRVVELNGEGREAEIDRVLEEDGRRPFDFERGPLVRATLMNVSARSHLLLITLPALCADAASLRNLLGEIADAYAAGPEAAAEPGEVVQYLQFSEWQNEVIADGDALSSREYWRDDIANYSPLTLPYERAGAAGSDFEPRAHAFEVDAEMTARLRAVAARHEVSLSALLLACWRTLLSRLTGLAEVVVGCVSDGRKYEELQESLGLVARALPIRGRFEAGAAFAEVLRETDEKTREAQDWLEYFAWPHSTESGEGAAETPFFSAAFEFASWPAPREAGGVTLSVVRQHSHFDRFKVKLNCLEQEQALRLELEYDSSLLAPESADRLSAQFARLLSSATEAPERAVGELELVAEDELRRLLVEFNDTARDYPKEKCVQQLFEAQAARTPERAAVVFGGFELSYRELNARANQLAAHLRTLGVGPEVLVAVHMERSAEMVVAILGVLKAGAAYVPLDLTYPQERLAFMMEDARVAVLLTQEHLAGRLPAHQAQVVSVDSDWPTIDAQADTDAPNRALPDNTAYVIYTSGSTGRPKGVAVTHQGLVNYLSWCVPAYGAGEGAGAPVHSPLGFDLTVTSLFAPLLAGQSAVLLTEEEGVEGLASTLRERGDYSLVKITPSHLEVLNQLLTPEQLRGTARALIIGGEALSGETLHNWRAAAPEVRLVNEYGPTETVVGCCVYEVAAGDVFAGTVPVGRPIANTQLYILDAYLRPVPAGVAGELFIGGDGLARGYLGRPGLTAERFLPNPFAQSHGARVYRTGDLARHLPDGNIEYLGRTDHQVKVRGFRVELGEIEAALWQHEAVREAVVVARQDVPGDTRLVAYVVPRQEQQFSTQELRAALRESLPEYMVPGAIVTLRALPLTLNGKVDRAALPAPGLGSTGLEESYVAPRTALEEVVASIWAETVGVPRVGVNDNFFELGGHSLLAMQVISRVREEFQVELPVRSIFDGMTVEGMAQAILAGEPEPGRSEKVAQVLKTVGEMGEDELLELLKQKRGVDAN
ncbi:MAG TPA: amino acid adenylation domain-containing protein [Pyrinomonadaceae bacterium]